MAPRLGSKDAEAILRVVEGAALERSARASWVGDVVAGFMRDVRDAWATAGRDEDTAPVEQTY
jgi:hypothetical protein